MNQQPVMVPQMCEQCQARLISHLKIPPSGPWLSTVIVANVMLFTAASTHEKVWQRCSPTPDGGRDAADLSLVLAEIGCLACFDRVAFNRIQRLMKKYDSRHVARIARGQIRDDPDWPYLLMKDFK